jgi:hypothetical protein
MLFLRFSSLSSLLVIGRLLFLPHNFRMANSEVNFFFPTLGGDIRFFFFNRSAFAFAVVRSFLLCLCTVSVSLIAAYKVSYCWDNGV